jgi:death on curing protein
VIYLTLPELPHVADQTLGSGYAVRDYGLLEAALTRPRATAFGKDAYPDLDAKAAALLHSSARSRAHRRQQAARSLRSSRSTALTAGAWP